MSKVPAVDRKSRGVLYGGMSGSQVPAALKTSWRVFQPERLLLDSRVLSLSSTVQQGKGRCA